MILITTSLLADIFTFPGCNRTYGGDNGRILSPRFPYQMSRGTNCSFSITVPQGRTISLYFGAFRLRGSPNCSRSSLKVRMSTGKLGLWLVMLLVNQQIRCLSQSLLAKFCRSVTVRRKQRRCWQISAGTRSQRRSCRAEIRSGLICRYERDCYYCTSSNRRRCIRRLSLGGWTSIQTQLQICNLQSSSYGGSYDISYTSQAVEATRGCGGTLFGTRGVVTALGFPGNYSQFSDCTWILRDACQIIRCVLYIRKVDNFTSLWFYWRHILVVSKFDLVRSDSGLGLRKIECLIYLLDGRDFRIFMVNCRGKL